MLASPEAATLQELGICITKDALHYYVPAVRNMRIKNEETMSRLQRKLSQDVTQRELEVVEDSQCAKAQLQEERASDLDIAKAQRSKPFWRADEAVVTDMVSM